MVSRNSTGWEPIVALVAPAMAPSAFRVTASARFRSRQTRSTRAKSRITRACHQLQAGQLPRNAEPDGVGLRAWRREELQSHQEGQRPHRPALRQRSRQARDRSPQETVRMRGQGGMSGATQGRLRSDTERALRGSPLHAEIAVTGTILLTADFRPEATSASPAPDGVPKPTAVARSPQVGTHGRLHPRC